MEGVPYPPFRVITFGSFSLNRLHSHAQLSEDVPFYEPIAEKIWRSCTAACSLLKLLLCRKSAAKLAAQAHLLTSLIGLHQNNLLQRELHCKQAVALSQRTQDKNLQVATRMWLAVTYYYSKHPRKALQIYQEALPDIGSASPLVQGCTYVTTPPATSKGLLE
jgi:hypothetical protein